MGEVKTQRPVLRLLAIFSRHDEALDWATRQAEAAWGPVALASPRFVFDQTEYYQASMGTDLHKQLLAFERLMDPGELPAAKLQTNTWEEQFADQRNLPEARPVNLDPGYVTEAKLVLASTKDRDHRLYLSQGIFAEVTLHYHGGSWKTRPWTYPDYATAGYHEFLDRCRARLRDHYRRAH